MSGYFSSLHIIQIDPRQLIISNPNVVKTHRTSIHVYTLYILFDEHIKPLHE